VNDAASPPAAAGPEPGLVTYTHAIYALHALAVLTGVLTSATIAGRFVFGLPSLAAVIMNYARRDAVQGSYLAAHFRWQIRTFWLAALWLAITLLLSAPLVLVGVGIFTALAGFAIVGIWVAYRVARGWLALRAGQSLPDAGAPRRHA
jgi:uncharacterized membrane protein